MRKGPSSITGTAMDVWQSAPEDVGPGRGGFGDEFPAAYLSRPAISRPRSTFGTRTPDGRDHRACR
jgi:hypothetical protein